MIKIEFYWPDMRSDVNSFIREYDTCQRNKVETIHPIELLQPLPIPKRNWTDISMDFVEGLPSFEGYMIVMVVVDILSKYAHFIPLHHPYTTLIVAKIFMENIFRL